MFTMWWVMMAAMMLPSAAPILLLFARVNRAERARDRPYVPTGIFAAGYLTAWGGFSAIATALQWALEQLGLFLPMMTTSSLLARRRDPDRRRDVAIHPGQGHLPAALPLADGLPCPELAAWPAWRLRHGA